MNTDAVDHQSQIPEIYAALFAVHQQLTSAGLEPGLIPLLQLRASQINRCAFCVDMHLREAREQAVPERQLDELLVWPQSQAFSARERAALAWTEALTELPTARPLGPLRADLRAHFSEREISVITGAIAMINLWNRYGVSAH